MDDDVCIPWKLEGDPTAPIESLSSSTSVSWLQLRRFDGGSLEAIGKLQNLVRLEFHFCEFEELPANLGQLLNLREILFNTCIYLTCLPENLNNLETLVFNTCISLSSLPPNLKISHLVLQDCFSYHLIDNFNLKSLNLVVCYENVDNLGAKLSNLETLKHLIVCGCTDHTMKVSAIPKLADSSRLEVLFFDANPNLCVKSLPLNNFSQLTLIVLPHEFRLESLPREINDSVVLRIHGKHGRKTLKELREDEDFSPVQDISPAYAYVRLEGNPSSLKHAMDYSDLVRVLELEFPNGYGPAVGLHGFEVSIDKFDKVTHLYISDSKHLEQHIHSSFIGLKVLKHLSLTDCMIESFQFILCKLFLDYLHLDLSDKNWPDSLNLPVTLRHLSLQRGGNMDSLFTPLEQLTNLERLDLYECRQLPSLPQNLKIFKLRLIDSSHVFKSLPNSLSHLQVIHFNCACCVLDIDYSNLINLESLLITCHAIKWLPTIKLPKLQDLKLRDCFSLTELPEIEGASSLSSLDLSGTRITFVPNSLLKLPNLHLILPKCMASEASISDQTSELYYHLMGFYNITSGVEHVKAKQKADGVRIEDIAGKSTDKHTSENDELTVRGLKRKITKEDILAKISEGKKVYEAAVEFGVSRSTVNRRLKEFKISWPRKQFNKGGAQPQEEGFNRGGAQPQEEWFSKGGAQVQGEGFSKGVAQRQGEASSKGGATVRLKPSYKGDSVRIDFSWCSDIKELNGIIRQKFNLEVNKFKVLYEDEDNELMLLTEIEDLKFCLGRATSVGQNFVRLVVEDK